MKKIGIVIALAIIATAFTGCVENKQSTQNPGVIDITKPTPQITSDEIVSDTGAAISSQANNAGQETIIGGNIGWLPITGEPLDIELTGYDSIARVYVYTNGKIDAELRDENLMKQQKAVGVKILLKSEDNKIYETGQVILGRRIMSSLIDDWIVVTGIKDATKMQWQPQFTIVNRELPETPVKKIST